MKTAYLSTRFVGIAIVGTFMLGCFSGCVPTYKAESIDDSIKDICKKEYGITDVDVKIVGKTLGVYLPLDQLFQTDFNNLVSQDENVSLENLLKFHPDAMDKVEDVLFTTSRVILSTDRPVDFYILKAGERESSGMELVLVGYVEDMKRVRFWDVSISEYRKRLLHDLTINHAVVWRRVIEEFFNDVAKLPTADLLKEYFTAEATLKDISPFFYSHLTEAPYKENLVFTFVDFKTKPISESEILVYAKVREEYTPRVGNEQYDFLFPSGSENEFLFVLKTGVLSYKIMQVIPFYYIDGDRNVVPIEFPEELPLYHNIKSWSEEFELEEMFMSDFLAKQITKRIQMLCAEDERINNTFFKVNIEMMYVNGADGAERKEPYYALLCSLRLKGYKALMFSKETLRENEDMRYLWDLVLREVTDVLNSYKFTDYSSILIKDAKTFEEIPINKDSLDLFRKKKISINEIFS